ncbi:hypothetical protein RDABS01_031553 [Bienertia sinuspersici]
MPLFGTLSYARNTFIGSFGIHHFLPFLQISPNLKQVFVTLDYDEVVPKLLLNNLDYLNLTGLQGNNDEINLVGYILKNAIVYADEVVEDEDAQFEKEYKFYKDCFTLPTKSSTTRLCSPVNTLE